ncbi:MAG: FAD:protein FMN transferase, partial [Spirochaetia bacterium]|nr:FAD:protein FMN transferase [Spirochaetia bacterium]
SVLLKHKGQSIDLGAIGKGYAAQCAMDKLRAFVLSGACLSIGGNTVVRGSKADKGLWRVGVQHPRRHDKLLGVVSATEASLVTSGDYERFFVDRAGERYHHILDPRTGYPSCSEIISSTVVHEDSLVADALSTSLFVLGLKRGLSLLAHFPSAKVVLVDVEGHLYLSKSLEHSFEAFEEASVTIL